MGVRRIRLVFLLTSAFLAHETLVAQNTPELKLDTGQQIYQAACIGCHGPGGKGQPESTLGFEKPPQFPDFSDCNGSTREDTFDWKATIHEGGPGRGWSDIMPSFSESLTLDQIDKVMRYLRTLCSERAWPLGEMNLPRALVTEKAFPEDEWVLTSAVNTNGPGSVDGELIYERRFGVGINSNSLHRTVCCNVTTRAGLAESGIWSWDINESCSPVANRSSACTAKWLCRRATGCVIWVPA